MSTSSVIDNVDMLGVVVLARHGDRQGDYRNPDTYEDTQTQLTPLGETQAFNLGSIIRSRYAARASTLSVITLSENLYNSQQTQFKADAGCDGSVCLDTALAIAQGLYPATKASNQQLADGTVVTSPLNGYQYVAVESIEPDQDISMEGWTDCRNFEKAAQDLLDSSEFQQKAEASKPFLDSLVPFLGGRPNTFDNMWNIYDYINVESIHNRTFRTNLPISALGQARELANFHQYNTFSDPNPSGIRNIAGHTVISQILDGLDRIGNMTDPFGLLVMAGSYEPFMSLFNIAGVTVNHPEVEGIVNYAAAIALEVRRPTNATSPLDLYVRLNFKNGTMNQDFVPYTMMGRPYGTYDIPYDEFVSTMRQYSVSSLSQWCDVCGTTDARGCDLVTRAESHSRSMNPIASGFIGAAIAFVVALIILGLLGLFGLLSWNGGKRNNRRKSTTSSRLSAIVPGRKKSIGSDAESQIGVTDINGAFELRDDVSVISRSPSEKITHD